MLSGDSIVLLLLGIRSPFAVLLLLRLLTGTAQGMAIPLLFSLVGDYFPAESRVLPSALLSACLGGGMLIGQLFCGVIFAYTNWRLPFVLLGVFGLAITLSAHFSLHEPGRGHLTEGIVMNRSLSSNEIHITYERKRGKMRRLLFNSPLARNLTSPTMLLILLQSFPGTIPWGILSTHLQDLLTQDFSVPIGTATSYIGIFGLGGAVGGIGSGAVGGYLYAISKSSLPLFMGLTCAASGILLHQLLSKQSNHFLHSPTRVLPTLLFAGAFAAVSGTNIRTVVINIIAPEFRGSAVGLLNISGCIGRGLGPSLAGLYIASSDSNRVEAVRACLYLWILSGAILCAAGLTISRDEEMHQPGDVKKFTPVIVSYFDDEKS